MRIVMMAAIAAMMLPGCSFGKAREGKQDAVVAALANPFPKEGYYHITSDSSEGGLPKRSETDTWVNVSNPVAFEEFVARDDGSNCRDRQVDIGGGQFNVKMTCDAPDGDIHNIGSERHGSYSADSIDISTETLLWGMPIRETRAYRFKGD